MLGSETGEGEVQRKEMREQERKQGDVDLERQKKGRIEDKQTGERKNQKRRGEERTLMLVWRTGYYTFLKTHIHHAGAHHLNEVILVFLIRLIINYLDVNCFAVDGKISIISKEQIGVAASQLGEGTGREGNSKKIQKGQSVSPRGYRGEGLPQAPFQAPWAPLRLRGALWHGQTQRLESQRFWVLIFDTPRDLGQIM